MNFLGHLYFSGNDYDLMAANLYGDFVKGKNLNHFSKTTQKGVYLHRQIDQYIDHHPAVIELMHQLYPFLPKVTGIAIDLFFDHLLAKNWKDFSKESLALYTSNFYESLNFSNPDYSPTFLLLLSKMKENNWLYHYQFKYGLIKACSGISSRLSFSNELKNGLYVFEDHEKKITSTFREYMKDAELHFAAIRAELNNLV